jgi:hypothetical protein
MPDFGDNKLSNLFEIVEAREAQYKASETQRDHADALAAAHNALADAEYTYRTALSARWKQLKDEGWAATVCGDIARGEESIATLRRARDQRLGEVKRLEELFYAFGADRRGLDGLVHWSRARDLRTDAPPENWPRPEGAGVPAGVNPKTGELRAAA